MRRMLKQFKSGFVNGTSSERERERERKEKSLGGEKSFNPPQRRRLPFLFLRSNFCYCIEGLFTVIVKSFLEGIQIQVNEQLQS